MSVIVTAILVCLLLHQGDAQLHQISHTDCQTVGEIISPNFNEFDASQLYPAGSDVTWVVTGNPGMKFMVKFIFFDVIDSTDCSEDVVYGYNGNVLAGGITLIFKECGYSLPDPFTTTGHEFTISFESLQTSPGARGFHIRYIPACDTCDEDVNTCSLFSESGCIGTTYCGGDAMSVGHMETSYNCQGGTVQCAMPCDTCQNAYADCENAIPGSVKPSCVLIIYCKCSASVGIGSITVIYYCSDGFHKCREPCCCEPRPGTGPAPAFNCDSPGVIRIKKFKFFHCP